ncbi:DegT/DnrJ/EryC1/StrS family aminotransferase [Actinoplanes sp. NPDC051851]|uniref:DegT/DnrJ/EryC1/StrS family aminotransferase n=1 Tax=Actinoplanes sp. NPDC051851 TaxID=3154753 RepID=UPI003413F7A2
MTTTDRSRRFAAQEPVPDRYAPPATGEASLLAEIIDSGRLSGGADIVTDYERALAGWFGVSRAIAVNSGSSALHATLLAAGVKPGDEVLVPATAPLPTALPILTCGAMPVIVDVSPASLALDPDDVAAKITDRTAAAISLPLWGYPADDRPAKQILDDAGIPLVEDACQAHGTRLPDGRYAGTLGVAGCFSTHERKLLATGEGGFVLTDDDELAEKIDYYTHLGHLKGGHGVNYKLAAPLAAIGAVRLRGLDAQLRARAAHAARLRAALTARGPLNELANPGGATPNYYAMVLTADRRAGDIAAAFTAAGLPPDSVRFAYRPLYHQPLFTAYATACPHAEALTATALQLPVHPGLSEAALAWSVEQIRRFTDDTDER